MKYTIRKKKLNPPTGSNKSGDNTSKNKNNTKNIATTKIIILITDENKATMMY